MASARGPEKAAADLLPLDATFDPETHEGAGEQAIAGHACVALCYALLPSQCYAMPCPAVHVVLCHAVLLCCCNAMHVDAVRCAGTSLCCHGLSI